MNDIMTVTGIVGTNPEHIVTRSGTPITSFRLASRSRRRDHATNTWVDGETNWYTVTTYRHLAFNLAKSVHKGDHVLVTGRLEVREWEKDGRRGRSVDIRADSVGHDLFWCTTSPVPSGPPKAVTDAGPDDGDVPIAAWADPQPAQAPLEHPGAFGSDGFMPAADGETRQLADVDS